MAEAVIKGVEAAEAIKSLAEDLIQKGLDYHAAYRAAQEAEKKLVQDLGEWATKVKRNGRYHHAFLSVENFEAHCKKNKAHFKVVGECTSTFGWAHLLYALNIRPEDDVVEWKVVTEKEGPLLKGDIHLEMPAEVLWHIINIFRMYAKPDPREKDGPNHYRFRFGLVTFEVFEEEQKIEASFDLKIATAGNETRGENYPFPLPPYNQRGGDRLRFGDADLVNTYLLAVGTGISQLELGIKPFDVSDDPERVLVERGKELVTRLKTLRSTSWDKSYLITPKWLEEANKIYRRLTSDKGEYVDLPKDIVAALKADASIAKVFDDQFKGSMKWEDKAIEILRPRVLLPGKDIKLSWEGLLSTSTEEAILRSYIGHYLPTALETFKNEPFGSLKHSLYKMKDETCYLFSWDPVIRASPGVLLEFSPEHALWEYDCVVTSWVKAKNDVALEE